MLSVVVFVGGFGGTVAAADTETDGSLGDSPGLDESNAQADTTESGTQTVGPTAPEILGSLPSLLGALDGGTFLGSQQAETQREATVREGSGAESAGLSGPMSIGVTAESQPPAAAPAAEKNNGSDTAAASVAEVVNEPEVPEAVVSYSRAADTASEPETPAAQPPPPPANPPAEEPAAVQPAANEIAPSEDSPAPVQAETAQLIGGAAPAKSIVTALAYLFLALTDDDAPLLGIPEGLLALLGLSATGDGTAGSVHTGGVGGSLLAGGMHSAFRAPLASAGALRADWPEMLVSAGVAHPTPAGVGASGTAEQHSLGVKAELADGLVPENLQVVLQHTIDAFLAPLSFVVLAAVASPGLAGLVLLSAAGMFFGYRQARAASMLRAVNIARFVKSGPLGVVRSGSLVVLHPRTSPSADEQPRRTHVESVA